MLSPAVAMAAEVRSQRLPARINIIIQTEIVNGERIIFFQSVPHGHYLVWWVRVSLGVKVRVSVEVRVSNLLGSG